MYDYGNKFENNQHYGQPTPPVYNMASIPKELPLFLSHGCQDVLSEVKDVKTLLATLKGHRATKLVVQYRKDYAHSDFVFGVLMLINLCTSLSWHASSSTAVPFAEAREEDQRRLGFELVVVRRARRG
ncbi:unnamed protein product [Camellia sinensis]